MSGIGSVTAAKPADATTTAEAKKKADLEKAASGFENILVKQMLATAKVAGKGEYADMGVDALSNAVTSGGGLGLSAAIQKAVEQRHHAAPTDAAAKTQK